MAPQPSVSGLVATANAQVLGAGQTITFTLTAPFGVSVIPGPGNALPELTLNNGARASYAGINPAGTELTFTYTVAAGQDTPNLLVTGLVLNGTSIGLATMTSALTAYPMGDAPIAIAVADVTGDGKLDLITADRSDSTVSVRAGDGLGGFGPRVSHATGAGPVSVAVADVTGDGKPDLVVADNAAYTVSVLAGDGLGGFSAPTSYAVQVFPASVAVADVTGDGRPDLVVANEGSNTVSVLAGDGLGGFATAVHHATSGGPVYVAVADVTGDGKLDLVTANLSGNTVSVLAGDGLGGFAAAVDHATGASPSSVAVADVTGDGKLDLVVTNFGGNTVSVLAGDGLGGFAAAVDHATGSGPASVAVADVTGDGKLDLVTADLSGNTLSVLAGDGLGGFAAASSYATGGLSPYSVTVADVTGNGRLDLVALNNGGDEAVVIDISVPSLTLTTALVPFLPGSNTGLVIDTTAPTVLSAAAAPGTAVLGLGGTATLTLTLDEAVTLTPGAGGSMPRLLLSTGGYATYAGIDVTGQVLTFTYAAGAGENTADLGVISLDPNGALVRDLAGNGLVLSGAQANPAGTLVVDTTGPVVTLVTSQPGTGPSGPDGTAVLTLALSEAAVVNLAGGAPTLRLSNGGVAVYDPAASTATTLAFRYVLTAGQAAASLTAVGVDLNGAEVRDPAGNLADLTVADTTAPDAPVIITFRGEEGTPDRAGLVLRGTAEAGSTVRVLDGATLVASATAGADGGWTAQVPTAFADGTHTLRATATDAAGNTSSATPVPLLLVQTAPATGVVAQPEGTVAYDAGVRGAVVLRAEGGDVIVGLGNRLEVVHEADALHFIDGRVVFNPDDAASQVARLYRTAFGRELDQGGMDYWMRGMEGGASLSGVAQGFLASTEGRSLYGAGLTDAEFVAVIYQNSVGRAVDSGGQAFWTGRLQAGATRADVLAGVSETAESRAALQAERPHGIWDLDEQAAGVARLYDTLLGRRPDAGGLVFWDGAVDGGRATLQGVSEQLMASAEYQAVYGSLTDRGFVEALYQNTLDRPGEAAGVGYWTGRLDAGLSRAAVAASFSESQEHVDLTAADIMRSTPGGTGIRLA